jgi:hypothetical protein
LEVRAEKKEYSSWLPGASVSEIIDCNKIKDCLLRASIELFVRWILIWLRFRKETKQ